MQARRAVLGCGLLAAGLHLPLFIGLHGAQAPGGSPARAAPMQVRTLPAPDAAPVAVPETMPPVPAAAPDPAPAPVVAERPAAETPPPVSATPPVFTPGPPDVPLPDAALPDGGVTLQVYLVVDDAGRVERVVARPLTGGVPEAFMQVAEHVLGDARLQPAGASRAYCLRLRFDDSGAAPQLDWLPPSHASRPERCLGGAPGVPSN